MFRTYRLGRSSDADMTVKDDSVSRRHLEVTFTDSGRFFCVDCVSTHGSYVWRDGDWQALIQSFVEPDEYIRLGKMKMRFADIVSGLKKLDTTGLPGAGRFELVSVRPRRNSQTGEVE